MLDLIEIEFWLCKFFSFIISKFLLFCSFIISKFLLFYSFIISNPILLIILCLIFIFFIPPKMNLKFKRFKKNLFFSIMLFIILLIFFELVLNIGGYFYFYVSSNLDSPKIEENTFCILFLGESTTAGAFLDNSQENAYPAQVEQILQKKYPNKKIRSYNKGVTSIETTAILRNLDRNMIKYKPNLVILMAGLNDHFVPNEKTLGFKDLYLRFKVYRFIAPLKDFIKIRRDPWLQGDDFRYVNEQEAGYLYKPIIYRSEVIFNLVSIINKVHSYSSEIWFVGYLQPDARERVSPFLGKLAEEKNITYFGDYPEIDFIVNRSLFSSDGWHPSKEGHKIIAEKIAEKIIDEGIIDHWTLGS